MNNKKLKIIMTKVAKGEISKKEADSIINPKKSDFQRPKQAKSSNTHKRSLHEKIKKLNSGRLKK